MKTVHRRAWAASVLAASLLAACSDDGGSAGGSSTENSGSVDGTGSAASLVPDSVTGTGPNDSSLVSTTSGAGGATTSLPGSTAPGGATTLPGGGTVPGNGTTLPPAATTDPFASTPELPPEEPGEMPGPPADDCVDAPAGPVAVELSFDDDDVLYAGDVAPSCVRIHAAQQLTVRSSSGAASLVLIGPDSYPMAAGAVVTTAVLGSLYAVGEVFDVFVDHLDTTVVVQVLP